MTTAELLIQDQIDDLRNKNWKWIVAKEETNNPSVYIPIQMTFLGLQVTSSFTKILRDFPVVELRDELVDGVMSEVEYLVSSPSIMQIAHCLTKVFGAQLANPYQLAIDGPTGPYYVTVNAVISDVDEGGIDPSIWYSTAQEFRTLKKLTNPTSQIGGQLFTLREYEEKVIKYIAP